MRLSHYERLNLVNQYQILSKVDAENKEHYETKIHILEGGYEQYYAEIFGSLKEEFPEEESEEIVKVLSMYRALHQSYDSLADGEKAEVDESGLAFKGFDQEQEEKEYAFATFVLEELGLFRELQHEDGYDADFATMPTYSRMVTKWVEFDKSESLNKEQIHDIVNA
ncbi:YfbU family protein [Halobacillus litoralis]|uniref:YfbU family protein n=1 Tax=Halobacillus litoralis TaxID=45668 RepID=UPI001CD658C8|nr:YfbU family protein [Halobacillus litoralis]MCA0970684.1 YfbU family protein [Halobacillus litoralis]